MSTLSLRFPPKISVAMWMIAMMASGSMSSGQAPARVMDEEAVALTSPNDELVFFDGDRVRGHLVKQEAEVLDFESPRFGRMRVSTKVATVRLAQRSQEGGPAELPRPTAPLSCACPGPGTGGAGDAPGNRGAVGSTGRTNTGSVWPIRALRDLFEPWHGKLTLSAESVTDAVSREAYAVNSQMVRKWSRNELQLNARYDYSETKGVTNTDMLKIDALWHHDLSRRLFTVYRPALEWNRAYNDPRGIATEYVLLQQEAGVGVNLLKGRQGHVSAGVSDNLFEVWITAPGNQHFSHSVQSVFAEGEWKLPCNITLSNRGVFYYAISSSNTGWENKLEIEKKLTEKLSIGARNEVRHNNPDVRISNFDRTLLYLGFEY